MSDSNPILEEAERRTAAGGSPLEGAGLAQDAQELVARVASGDWTEGLVSLLSAGLEVKSFVEDPLAKLSSMGLGWLIEHVGWLREPLDWMTGDQERLSGSANAWTVISDEMRQAGQDLDGYYKADAARWAGPAVERYRTFCADRVHYYTAAADAASGASTLLTICKGILAVVRSIIRDLITDCVGKIISIVARYPPPTTPGALPEVTAKAVETSDEIMTWVRKLQNAFANAGRLFKDSGNLFRLVRDRLGEATTASGAARTNGLGAALWHATAQTAKSVWKGDIRSLRNEAEEVVLPGMARQAAHGAAEAAADAVKEMPAKAAMEGAKEVAKDSAEDDLYDGSGPYRVTGTL